MIDLEDIIIDKIQNGDKNRGGNYFEIMEYIEEKYSISSYWIHSKIKEMIKDGKIKIDNSGKKLCIV